MQVVPGGTWQGARTLGRWSLVGTTMAPPFDWDTFELGDRVELLDRYPAHRDAIECLTRTS